MSPSLELPLSHAQRRIWLLEQVYPASALGNLSGLLHVDGPVDAERLAAAVDGFVRETPSARLQLVPGPGLPRQFVAGVPRERTPVLDFGRAADPLGEARAWAATQARTPRPTLEGPLADFAVLSLGGGRALLYAKVHHLIADAASLALFSRSVNQRYQGEPVDVSGDFAAALAEEQAYLASDKATADRDAWVETLARCQPSFRTRPGGSPRAVRHSFELGAAEWAALSARLRARGTTFNRFLAAAAAGALHALTGQPQVTVGAYTHGRWTRPSLRTFGMFVGTLPVPIAVPAQGGLDALLDETGRALQRGLRASRYPFDLALDQAGRRGELVYDSLVSFQSEGHHPTFAGHPAHIEWLFSGAETHPLVIHAADRAQHGTLSVEVDLRLDAFPDGAPAALAEGLEQWVRGAAAAVGTGAGLRTLSVVGPKDRARQDARNATTAPVPASALERAVASLRARGAQVVLHDARGTCTGDELLALAGGVAQALGDVGSGDVVALALPRGRGLVAAMLAVGARGATYLPTDGAWPPERLRGVLADSGAKRVVHDGQQWPALREHALPVVDVASVSPAPLRPVPLPADAAAYLIYTSGTSGRPKGVRVGVGALANFVGAMEAALPWASARTILGVTSPSFDIFALETWLPLATGVKVCFTDGDSAALDGLAQVLARTPCDVVQLTPSRLQLFLQHPGVRAALAPVRLLLVGGEALPDALRAEARAALPGARLFNLYGPTETTVWSTTAELTHASRVHVGLPIANTTVALVSPSGFELPSGLPGELWLGGAGVALGYHARAELTAERFVPHPRLGRMYRTGDLARWASDGVLEHLGRLDAQVKIAGHRVELQELEALLLECAGVRQAVVVVARGPKGDPVLMAHVVGEASSADLERSLRQHLPAALMPRAIERHAHLPVLPSGKVDRTALAARALPASGGSGSSLPPSAGPVLEAWTQVLGAASDPDESFFALGGTSVLAVQLAAAVEARTARRLDLGAFFAEPTLRALVDQLARAPAVSARAPSRPSGPSLEQQRIALALELAGPQLAPRDYHLSGVVAVHGPLDLAALERALVTLAERHEALRTALVREGGALTLVARPAQVPLRRHQGAATPEALLDVLVAPMALEQGAFLRAAVQQVEPALHWLAVDVHHAAADARSLELLLQELARLLAGEALPAPAPFFSLAQDEDTRPVAEAFWRDELTRHPEAYSAAREASPGPVGLHTERLDAAEVTALGEAAAQLGVTTVDLALSALAFALEPWDGRPERAALLTVAGRSSEAAWRAVGPFARAVPVRLPAGGGLTATAQAREVSRR
ncbi:MAG: amino acid adenylation domain-containing protein, partial [Myxococcaceae bacterium]|nr:amino acid adenylation domain-containing protein [Myxococcaceae bacterium]